MTLLDGLFSYCQCEETGDLVDIIRATSYTETNGPIASVEGKNKLGRDYEFSSSQYFDTGVGLLDGITDLTISFWAKQESASANGVYGQGHSSTSTFLETTRLFFRGGAAQSLVFDASPFITGVWQHIVIRRDLDGCSIWVDNQLFDSLVAAGAPITTAITNTFRIGQVPSGTAAAIRYWDGILDEFAMWNRVLTDEEVAQLYNNGNGFFYPFTSNTIIIPRRRRVFYRR